MRGERETTDAILEQERQRSDAAVTQRDQRDLEGGSARAHERQMETDERLSTERHGTDDAVSALGLTKGGRRYDQLHAVGEDACDLRGEERAALAVRASFGG